jgi:L-2-hydroxyglutarate oxidase
MHIVVVGAGIVGLAVAARLAARGDHVTVLDKECGVARHQTGRNSGVIHSGLYYAPDSLKATMSIAGARSITAYAGAHGIEVKTPGKLVVATTPEQVPGLERLAARGRGNGVTVQVVDPAEAREHEPNVRCVRALWVPRTGTVDYAAICRALADDVVAAGGEVRTETAFVGARERADGLRIRVEGTVGREELAADRLVACAGLQSDRVARSCGLDPAARIIPFRGEYFALTPQARALVNGLIYPIPDPRFPFLGMHLTRMVNGSVLAGPNAVLALAREGYRKRDVDARDVLDELGWPGLWRMGARNVVPGAGEMVRSASKRLFAHRVAALVPELGVHDLVRAAAGVRAQAIARDGEPVDDFLVQRAPRQVHVLNAPSPAATCALEIATHVTRMLDAE